MQSFLCAIKCNMLLATSKSVQKYSPLVTDAEKYVINSMEACNLVFVINDAMIVDTMK